ncbi:hypothetical protein BDW02DRAFT_583467 [Decorospora gaudefroyi]|uniref:Uncharacterized protein n=1 Tax=Decorospora gaudefroyi TaxID=184978 RepID=A0A6A5K0J5_9PLEO|nr:hypothetical protein BDW02DRAFT_583467 [Decorospora gaudefroyi]
MIRRALWRARSGGLLGQVRVASFQPVASAKAAMKPSSRTNCLVDMASADDGVDMLWIRLGRVRGGSLEPVADCCSMSEGYCIAEKEYSYTVQYDRGLRLCSQAVPAPGDWQGPDIQ